MTLTKDLDAQRLTYGLPGLAWAVAPVDGPLLAGAHGVRHLGSPGDLTVFDRLHLGSCTKPMTASLLATLTPDLLHWHTPLTDVFPASEMHEAYRDVTVTDLLSHHSSLPPFDDDKDFLTAPSTQGTPAQDRTAFVRWVLQQPPGGPRGQYLYSNAGFGVAAVMAEHLTGQAYEDLMAERVFGPLGLTSAGFGWPARHNAGQPWGHQWKEDHFVPHDPHGPYQLHPGIGPAGDAHMDILDFAAFARAHLRGLRHHAGWLNAETVTHMHTPALPGGPSGLGWGVSQYRERRASSHSGSAETFLALVLVLPEEGHAFVVVTNAAGGPAEDGTMRIMKHLVAQFTTANVRV